MNKEQIKEMLMEIVKEEPLLVKDLVLEVLKETYGPDLIGTREFLEINV